MKQGDLPQDSESSGEERAQLGVQVPFLLLGGCIFSSTDSTPATTWAGGMVQWVECLLCKHENLS